MLQITPLRKNVTYVRVYTSLITSVVMVLIPTYVLAFSTKKVYDKLNTSVESNHALSDERKQARLKRNQSITRILIGIIILFLLCHTGKVRPPHIEYMHSKWISQYLRHFSTEMAEIWSRKTCFRHICIYLASP